MSVTNSEACVGEPPVITLWGAMSVHVVEDRCLILQALTVWVC